MKSPSEVHDGIAPPSALAVIAVYPSQSRSLGASGNMPASPCGPAGHVGEMQSRNDCRLEDFGAGLAETARVDQEVHTRDATRRGRICWDEAILLDLDVPHPAARLITNQLQRRERVRPNAAAICSLVDRELRVPLGHDKPGDDSDAFHTVLLHTKHHGGASAGERVECCDSRLERAVVGCESVRFSKGGTGQFRATFIGARTWRG